MTSNLENFLFLVFGITGDLCKRKIIPAIYQLIKEDKINNFVLLGVSNQEKSTEKNIEQILESSKRFIKNLDEKVWQKLISISFYQNLDITQEEDYKKLDKLICDLEKKFKLKNNRLVFCATSSKLFEDIVLNLASSGIIQKTNSSDIFWHRIIFEKPFGQSLKTAKKLNKEILAVLNESQIFRIDHYLAKQIIETIAYIRFTNQILEPLWNNKYIDSIQIILDEEVCLEGRGKYYDQYGALKDVVQNHMLQLAALVAMEAPKRLSGDYIRDKKADVLKKIKIVDGILGQYENYTQESGVNPDSKTETFAALKFFINNKRWRNVPFYFKTGKSLEKKQTKIEIKFKQPDCLLEMSCPVAPNYLTISIYPQEGILLEINAKKPNAHQEIITFEMDLCYSCLYAPENFHAYESIILELLKGAKEISVRQDEIEYSWRIIDQVESKNFPLYIYKNKSNGPKEVYDFAKKNGIEWR